MYAPAMRRFLARLVLVLATLTWPCTAHAQRPDLSGNWIRGGGPITFTQWTLTAEGERKLKSYDFMKDDPGYGCIASSWTRAWMNPNVLVRITQNADSVRVQHEFMDIDRVIPLVDPKTANAKRSSPVPKMPGIGRSSAWYDGDTLVVDTVGIPGGWMATMEKWAGLPQSARMHTTARLRRSGNALTIEIAHEDPVYYRTPVVATIPYVKTDWELMRYDCLPEEAAVVGPKK
jgi:hypothetical protein